MRSASNLAPALLVATLALGASSASAGPPPGWQPGVEGQAGFGPPTWSSDGTQLAITGWSRATLSTLAPTGTTPRLLSAERGAGFHPVWVAGGWLFKEATRDARGRAEQRIVWADAGSGERRILERGPALGDPSMAGSGLVAWSRGATLSVREPSSTGAWPLRRRLRLPTYANLVALSPSGSRAALAGDDGSTLVLELADGQLRRLDAPAGSVRPEWSSDGKLLLVRSPNAELCVLDASTGARVAITTGTNPSWVPGRHEILFDRVETWRYDVLGSELWLLRADDGTEAQLTSSARHERFAAAAPDGRSVAFVDTRRGDLLVARLEPEGKLGAAELVLAGDAVAEPVPRSGDPAERAVEVFVPYLHQLWDTPDDFNGGWSCGPTSCVQTIARYQILPAHDITCSSPSSHTSHWGWYIPSEYEYGGYTYDVLGLADGDVWVPGAHGFICRDLGAAYWSYMVTFCNQHGLDSWQEGTTFGSLPTEVDAGYSMYASTSVLGYGHIIVMKGYDPNHSVVTNDPYGDANGSWGQYNGDGAVYDWPGYNNGNLEIGVSQLFGARGTIVEPEPVWNATHVSSDYPATMVAGQRSAASVRYTNTGDTTWDTVLTNLGTTEPRDRESPFYDAASWSSPSRPSPVDAATAPGATGRFGFDLVAPEVTEETSYTECFGLVQEAVTWFGPADDAVCFDIVVLPPDAPGVPVADAGPDQTVALGSSITLDGSGSTDSDGTIVAWSWEVPEGVLAGETIPYAPAELGSETITLTVTDDLGLVSSDTVTITVVEGGSGGAPGGVAGDNGSGCGCRLSRRAPRRAAEGAAWLGAGLLALARRRRGR